MHPFVLHFLSWYFFFDSILDGRIQKEFLIHFPSPRGKDQLYLLKRTKPENVEISQRQDQFIKQIKKLSTFCCRGTLIKKGFTSTLPHVDESRIISVPNKQSFVMMDCLNIFLQLINAYAGVVECSHLVGWKGWGKTYEKIGKNRYNAFIGSCMICNC